MVTKKNPKQANIFWLMFCKSSLKSIAHPKLKFGPFSTRRYRFDNSLWWHFQINIPVSEISQQDTIPTKANTVEGHSSPQLKCKNAALVWCHPNVQIALQRKREHYVFS